MKQERRQEHRGRGRPRDAQRERGHERPAVFRVVGRLARDDPRNVALPERLRRRRPLLGLEVRNEVRDGAADTGDDADGPPEQPAAERGRPPRERRRDPPHPTPGKRPAVGDGGVAREQFDHLRHREQPDDRRDEGDAALEVLGARGVANPPGDGAHTVKREDDPDPARDEVVDDGAVRGDRDGGDPDQGEPEVLRRPERERHGCQSGQQRRKEHKPQQRTGAGRDRAGGDGLRATALFRKREPVVRRRRVRRRPRSVQEDGRDRPAEVDSAERGREHQEREPGLELERDRDQKRQRDGTAQPGDRADDHAQKRPPDDEGDPEGREYGRRRVRRGGLEPSDVDQENEEVRYDRATHPRHPPAEPRSVRTSAGRAPGRTARRRPAPSPGRRVPPAEGGRTGRRTQ